MVHVSDKIVSVISTVKTGHEDMINDAQMDHYGCRLATCSSDMSVRIYEVKNGAQTLAADLRGHEGPVWQISWAHPKFGSVLASCSYDRKVIIWNELNGQWAKAYEYNNHDSSVNSVCWAPHDFGLILACGSSDGSVSIITSTPTEGWQAKKINAHTIGCNAVSWAPAISPSSALESSSGAKLKPVKRFVSGGFDNMVRIWREDEEWIEEAELVGHSDWVRDVAWAPLIGLARTVIASCSHDCRVILWTNDRVPDSWTGRTLHTFEDVVWHVSWSATGNILAVSGSDNKVSLWKEESVESRWVCISDVNRG